MPCASVHALVSIAYMPAIELLVDLASLQKMFLTVDEAIKTTSPTLPYLLISH